MLAVVSFYFYHESSISPGYKFLHILAAWAVGIILVYAYAFVDAAFYFRSHGKGYGDAEVKRNLYDFKLAVERYATDNEGGYYPDYILGGGIGDDFTVTEGFYNAALKAFQDNPNDYEDVTSQKPEHFASENGGDYTIMEGYMPYYPRNPLRRTLEHNGSSRIQKFPSSLPGPFRRTNLGPTETSEARMVQVAADHRFPGALIGERYWLRKKNNDIAMNVAGSFIYKGLIPPGETHPRGYILMVFGRAEDIGQDALTTVPGGSDLDGRLQDGSGVGEGVPVIPELGLKGDGKPDGIILVLIGGWPFGETGEKHEK
jgi:hypothetical protein